MLSLNQGGIKIAKVLIPMCLNQGHIISQPPLCATIGIKHLGVVIFASPRIKHVDWFMLVSKRTQQ